mgnify:CR=1 FL=1
MLKKRRMVKKLESSTVSKKKITKIKKKRNLKKNDSNPTTETNKNIWFLDTIKYINYIISFVSFQNTVFFFLLSKDSISSKLYSNQM